MVLTTPYRKNLPCERDTCALGLDLSCGKRWKRDIRFGAWNVWSLYRSGSLTAGAMELARYKLDRVDKGSLGEGV